MAKDDSQHRVRLNRDRVLQAAVTLADEIGIDALSMRRLAQELDVVPMALYRHVANKEELLDGMVEVLIGEINPALEGVDWKATVRHRVLSARRALLQHAWSRQVIETRTNKTPAVLAYMESMIGMFLAGGFSADLTHHVMHALGGRMWGFTQELFDESRVPSQEAASNISPEMQAQMMQQMAQVYPNIVLMAGVAQHDDSVVGHGCDDEFEFAFTLDVMLDGFERLHEHGWTSKSARQTRGRQNRHRGRSHEA